MSIKNSFVKCPIVFVCDLWSDLWPDLWPVTCNLTCDLACGLWPVTDLWPDLWPVTCTLAPPLQKRRDWIRKRLKFTVKIIFFDAAIGSNNYVLQEYLSKDSGQPIGLYTMSNNGFYSKLYFTMNTLEQR